MIETVTPRDAEQPSDITSSAGGPPAGRTFSWVSNLPASGSCGCSRGGVDRRPSPQARQFLSRRKCSAIDVLGVESRRSAIETTDASPKNLDAGDNRMHFSIDKLFHRRLLQKISASPPRPRTRWSRARPTRPAASTWSSWYTCRISRRRCQCPEQTTSG